LLWTWAAARVEDLVNVALGIAAASDVQQEEPMASEAQPIDDLPGADMADVALDMAARTQLLVVVVGYALVLRRMVWRLPTSTGGS